MNPIGAGMLGRRIKKYADLRSVLTDAAQAWSADVTNGTYPAPEHTYT